MASYNTDIENFAPEILLEIFSFLNPVQQAKCRTICNRWKDLVDSFALKEDYWRYYCRKDFKHTYKISYEGQAPEISWQNLYRSLCLWTKLHSATEKCTQFPIESINGEIIGFQLQRYGHIGIHSRTGTVYFDITIQKKPLVTTPGNHFRYAINDETIVTLGHTTILNITRKFLRSPYHQREASFPSVKNFVLTDHAVYFVTLDNFVCVCNLIPNLLQPCLLTKVEDNVMSLGFENGHLHVMTFSRHVYTYFQDNLNYRYQSDETFSRWPGRYHLPTHYDMMLHQRWKFKQTYSLSRSNRNVNVLKIHGDEVYIKTGFGIFNMPIQLLLSNQFNFLNQPACIMNAILVGNSNDRLMFEFYKELQNQFLKKYPRLYLLKPNTSRVIKNDFAGID